MPQSPAGRSAGAGHSPQRVGTRPGERAVRDCVRLGRPRVRGRTRAAPLRNSGAIRPHLAPRAHRATMPGASGGARVRRARSRAALPVVHGLAGTYGREAGTGVRPRPGVWLTARPLRRRMASAPEGRGYDRPALLRAAVERSRRPVAHMLARRSDAAGSDRRRSPGPRARDGPRCRRQHGCPARPSPQKTSDQRQVRLGRDRRLPLQPAGHLARRQRAGIQIALDLVAAVLAQQLLVDG